MVIHSGRKGMRPSSGMLRSSLSMYWRGMRVAQNTIAWHAAKIRKHAQPYPGTKPTIRLIHPFFMRFLSLRSRIVSHRGFGFNKRNVKK